MIITKYPVILTHKLNFTEQLQASSYWFVFRPSGPEYMLLQLNLNKKIAVENRSGSIFKIQNSNVFIVYNSYFSSWSSIPARLFIQDQLFPMSKSQFKAIKTLLVTPK